MDAANFRGVTGIGVTNRSYKKGRYRGYKPVPQGRKVRFATAPIELEIQYLRFQCQLSLPEMSGRMSSGNVSINSGLTSLPGHSRTIGGV